MVRINSADNFDMDSFIEEAEIDDNIMYPWQADCEDAEHIESMLEMSGDCDIEW